MRQIQYNALWDSTNLDICQISQACAKQRAGRCGRTQNGTCYRLYSDLHFNNMDEYPVPEIQRIPLTEICLKSKRLIIEL